MTWHKKETNDYYLRGCIGTFKPDLLEKIVKKYALISAFEDTRFNKIDIKEVPFLSCAISLLTNFEPAKTPIDWEIGKHGIQIEFKGKNNNEYGGTYLPEVMSEQKWDHDMTLNSLVKKAGYKGKLEDVYESLKVVRYQSQKCSITFEEYKEMRKNNKIIYNFSI